MAFSRRRQTKPNQSDMVNFKEALGSISPKIRPGPSLIPGSQIFSVLSVRVDGYGEQEALLIYLIINMFAHASCPPCLIFIWVSSTPIDNQLLTKTFCSPPRDRLSVRDAGMQKDCGLMRRPHPAHSGYQAMSPSSGKLSKLA